VNSFTAATTIEVPVESAIWTFDPATKRIIPHWINTDGCTYTISLEGSASSHLIQSLMCVHVPITQPLRRFSSCTCLFRTRSLSSATTCDLLLSSVRVPSSSYVNLCLSFAFRLPRLTFCFYRISLSSEREAAPNRTGGQICRPSHLELLQPHQSRISHAITS
jgi:hypothetical protein